MLLGYSTVMLLREDSRGEVEGDARHRRHHRQGRDLDHDHEQHREHWGASQRRVLRGQARHHAWGREGSFR